MATKRYGIPILVETTTFDPSSLSDGDAASTTVSISDAGTGGVAVATHDSLGSNDVVVSAHVQSSGTVRVVLVNQTGGSLDIGSGTIRVMVIPA